MQQKTKGKAIIGAKCPRCRKGDLFQYPLAHFRKFAKFNQHCPCCNFRFEVEPGFFFGAMYVSYAFIVAIVAVVSLIVFFLFEKPSIWVYVGAVYAAIMLLLPAIFRYSRVLYLYWFGGVSYDCESGKNCQ